MKKAALFPLATIVVCLPLGGSAHAAPTMGTWLDEHLSSETQGPDLRNTWSPLKGDGWTSLPARMVGVVTAGANYPLCATNTGSGWVGIGRVRVTPSKVFLQCETFAEDTNSGYFFDIAAAKPVPMWLNTVATSPEPRGAIPLLTQETSRRRIFACKFDKGADLFVGHIGDDGRCQGTTRTGTKDTATSYLTLVTKGTGPDAQPRYGWVEAGPTYAPHAPSLATATLSDGKQQHTWTLCSATDGGQTWPGWMKYGNCSYFTYVNGTTTEKTATSWKVHRVKPGAAQNAWVFNRSGGKPFYACTSVLSAAGTIRAMMFGFTNNPTTCTDGRQSTDAPPKLHSWSRVELVKLPDADADAG